MRTPEQQKKYEIVRKCRAKKKGLTLDQYNAYVKSRGVWKKMSNSERHLYQRYKMTVAAFQELLVQQDGKCAICKKDITATKAACVDHDHETGKIRGLLCRNCNRGLGLLGDTLGAINATLEYLKSHLS